MHEPVTSLGKSLKILLEKHNINTNITKRWEEGAPHHKLSEKLARELSEIDWMYCSDFFGFKFGGDGDNGEFLLYELDILLDLLNAEGISLLTNE